MDVAVALVQAYLQVNGYFTVAEYPVLEALRHGARSATDLDILAFRFPLAGCETRHGGRHTAGPVVLEPDSALSVPADHADMIVGEVKQGTARFNAAGRDPLVLQAALVRFGCCAPDTVAETVRGLLRKGRATTPAGHTVRMIAFGCRASDGGSRHQVITMEHIIAFLRAHLREHWHHLGKAQLSQPALAFLALMEKAERAGRS